MYNDNRAPEEVLASLHGEFANFLAQRLKSGEVTGAELNCIRQFLKDNGIDCVGRENPDISDITANLPAFEDTGDDDMRLMN
ncbi:MAG: hypothetical protein K2O70_02865 [Desulfovibrionaceae bacterium]|nr:hypothetical protein [Desulfovibrionaceae bacterium]